VPSVVVQLAGSGSQKRRVLSIFRLQREVTSSSIAESATPKRGSPGKCRFFLSLLLLLVAGAGESFFLSEMLMVDEDVKFCELALDGVLAFWTIIRTATISSCRNVNLYSLDPFKILVFCHLPLQHCQ
jgi:hypothetical protein